jgi:cytochrome P450
MANTHVTQTVQVNTKASASDRVQVDVDSSLLKVIGSPSIPGRTPKPPSLPKDIPGKEGTLTSIVGVLQGIRRGIAFSLELRARYGDVVRGTFVGTPVLVLWDADEIHRILKNDDQLWSTAMGWDTFLLGGLDPRAGNTGTLLSLDFDEHRAARKLVQPAFTLKAIDGYLSMADRTFAPTIATWTRRGNVGLKKEMRTLLARVSNAIFTGLEDPREVEVIDRALSDFWKGMLVLSKNPWLSPTFRRARAGLATLIEKLLALVPERRRTGGDDLFSRMCAIEDTEGFSDEALVRIFITVMFGAFDTTSAAMTSMGYLLARNFDWQERLREEARSVGAGPLGASAMKGMKLHEWVWKETLRLMPVNGFIPRRALREAVVAGHTLPAGALVLPMNGGIGRHPKWWKDADKFDPERFSPERAEDRQHPGIYNPFGGGAHACVGMQLANMEMKLFWHRMLTSCRFRLTRDYVAHHTFSPFGVVSGDVGLTIDAL